MEEGTRVPSPPGTPQPSRPSSGGRSRKVQENNREGEEKGDSSLNSTSGSAAAAETEQDVTVEDFDEPSDPSQSCRFWFVKASEIKLADYDDFGPSVDFGELKKRPGWLVEKEITLNGAIHGHYVAEYAAGSHRWETPDQPDPQGVQFHEIQAYLEANPGIEWFWYDFWCMPQVRAVPPTCIDHFV